MDDTSNLIGHCNSPHCNMKIEDAAIDDHNGVSLPVSKYFKTLVKELHNEPENCQKFVLLLKDFRNKSIDHVGVLLNLEELLKHKLHLFHGFKELLNEVDCVEREQTKAELAFLYVCKVKDHFHNDQRFQIFTEIFTKFTLNEKTKLEVYHEMQELFGSHKELFEEFRKFYGAVPEAMPLLSEPSGATLKNQDGREDCSKEDQECKESNIGDKKANLVEPKSSSKRKRMQTGDIITANHQQEGGSVEPDVRMGYVNNEMDRVDKAKSCRDSGAGRGKAPVAVDEIVPEANKALSADDKIVPEPPVYEGDDSVQNDDSVAANGSCGKSVRLVDQYEQALFKVEDDRFESDMLRNLVASTAMRVEDLLKKISNKTVEQTPLCLEDHFTQQSLQCIEEMYREYSPEVKEALRNDPATALPVLLARLEKKKQGVSILKSDLDKIWRAASERNYKLSRQLQRSIPSIRT